MDGVLLFAAGPNVFRCQIPTGSPLILLKMTMKSPLGDFVAV